MEDPKEPLIAFKSLNEEANLLYKLEAYKSAITRHDKAMQYICVFVPSNKEEVNMMEDLGCLLI